MREEELANPGPLGLLGFGMATILLNLHNAEVIPLAVDIVAMGFALGGIAQLIAGIIEFKRNNLFGATAFTLYGLFWWSLILIWWNPFRVEEADPISMGFYLLMWGIFTVAMAICTLRHNRATQVVFFSLALLFFLLSLSDFTGNHVIHITAGIVGIFCGCSAIYTAFAEILNHEFGRTVLPLGSMKC